MRKIFFHFLFLINIEYIILFPNCQFGVNFCEKCHPITKLCVECEKNVYTPDENGGCKPLKKCIEENNHCFECNKENNLCQKCEESYYPDENGGCSYTNNCEISYEGKCLKCKKDYILLGKNDDYLFKDEISICKSLNHEDLKNCEIINTDNGICEKCKNGYFLNVGDRRCISIENCYESIFGSCIKCNYGFYLNKKEGKCYKQKGILLNCKETLNNKTCEICEDNYYLDELGMCCSIKYCQEKGDYYQCLKCIKGYFLSKNEDSCTREENCLYGDKDLGLCTMCENNYYIDFKDGKCKSNKEDNEFKYCEIADEICLKCKYGTFLGKDNKCSFSRHCSESNLGECFACEDKYYLGLDNICNIELCIYSNSDGFCIECEKNYYYNTKGNNCKISDGKFENCKIGTEDGNCQICHNDFYFNKKDNLCYSNTEEGPFYKCSYSDSNGEKCIQCLDNYYLGYIDNLCTTMEGCDISENENKCIQCGENYCLNLNDNRCYQNYEIKKENDKFYFRCNQTNINGTECQLCLDGYILKNGLCVDEEHCIEMANDICKTCQNDEFVSFCLNELFGCVEINSKHCLECKIITDFNICDKCEPGYVLNGFDECQLPQEE